MPEQLRHAILGVGGVGGLIGASLGRCGFPVTLVVKPEVVDQYPRHLRLESPFGNYEADFWVLAEVPAVDVLWLTVKATQLDAALAAITHPESVKAVVPLLNGIDHVALLRSKYGNEKIIPATIAGETERVAAGHIVHRSPFARLNVSSAGRPLLEGTLGELQQLGFQCQFIDHEPTLMWSKLAFLAPFALTSTAADKTTDEIFSDPHWRDMGLSCIRETCAVAVAEGAKLSAETVIVGAMAMGKVRMRSSMQKDVEKGNPPELDAIAGPILRGARRHGIAVPATEKLVEAVEQRAGLSPSTVG